MPDKALVRRAKAVLQAVDVPEMRTLDEDALAALVNATDLPVDIRADAAREVLRRRASMVRRFVHDPEAPDSWRRLLAAARAARRSGACLIVRTVVHPPPRSVSERESAWTAMARRSRT